MNRKIVKVEYADHLPMPCHGVPTTGRVITIEYLEDSFHHPKGSKQEFNEDEDDWTFDYDDKELIGIEY